MSNIKKIVGDLLTSIDGCIISSVVDNNGMQLGSAGSGLDLDVAAAGMTEVLKAKLKVMKNLGLNDTIEDILITLGKQYHIIRPTQKYDGLFIYIVVDKANGNLAMARRLVQTAESNLVI